MADFGLYKGQNPGDTNGVTQYNRLDQEECDADVISVSPLL